ELACTHCGVVFSAAVRTKTINGFKHGDLERVRRVGEATVQHTCRITLQIDDEPMELPNNETVVLGRETMMNDTLQPDVDLSPYNAHENGVSHLHLKLIRKRDMVYVVDLGSTNGSYLNGVKLMPKQERVLRSGDELMLGRLRMRVKF